MSPSLFVPEGAFEVLVKQQIARLLEPSLECAALVYEELRRLVLDIQLPELLRYYKLQSRMHDVMESVLNDCLNPTNEMILNLIEIETSLINTNHPDFIGSADSLLNLFQEPDFIAKKTNKGEDNLALGEDDLALSGTGEGGTFSLMTKPGKPVAQTETEEKKVEVVEDLKRSTLTDYLPRFFGGRNNDSSSAAVQ